MYFICWKLYFMQVVIISNSFHFSLFVDGDRGWWWYWWWLRWRNGLKSNGWSPCSSDRPLPHGIIDYKSIQIILLSGDRDRSRVFGEQTRHKTSCPCASGEIRYRMWFGGISQMENQPQPHDRIKGSRWYDNMVSRHLVNGLFGQKPVRCFKFPRCVLSLRIPFGIIIIIAVSGGAMYPEEPIVNNKYK